jgi:hypothetical protein
MAMLGIDYPTGSFEENLAVLAINRKKQTQFLTTLVTVNAIIYIGNCIQAALSGGSAPKNGVENLQKILDSLKALLIPGAEIETESKAARALKILEEEVAKGPLIVRPMVENKKNRGRFTRGRSK